MIQALSHVELIWSDLDGLDWNLGSTDVRKSLTIDINELW